MKRIKNKIQIRMISAAAIVAAFLFGTTPIMAHAGGYECTCEHKCTEDCINPDCELCKIDYTLCCGDEETEDPEAPAEETPETEEEPEEEWGPLTPDGNMTLVDDYGAPSQAGKQFITVVTKAGNYFYIIIDRDDHGEQTVHFLNLVDEEDLMALVDQDTAEQMKAQKEAEEAARKAAEDAIRAREEKEAQKEPEIEEPKKKEKTGLAAVVLSLLALGGIAAGGFYLYRQKGITEKAQHRDPDDDYYFDDDDEDELRLPEEKEPEAQDPNEGGTYEGW